jgi:hypothetical protein
VRRAVTTPASTSPLTSATSTDSDSHARHRRRNLARSTNPKSANSQLSPAAFQ